MRHSLSLSTWRFLLVGTALVLLTGCDMFGDKPESHEEIYPMYVDSDGNGVNDFVEVSTHDSGSSEKGLSLGIEGMPPGSARRGHAFLDENSDDICDYAQNGSATWHGPGFIDENSNGICDYWDEAAPRHHRHDGMRFQDHNENRINDYFEAETHRGPAHSFVDENGDGICDRAQDGSPTWHGPNFVDNNGDGRCDYWEEGGRGHGGHHRGGGR